MKPKGAFSLFFDYDDSSEESFEGGKGSSSSGESITTETDDSTRKMTYNGVTIPSNKSSGDSISTAKSSSSPLNLVLPTIQAKSDSELSSFPKMESSEESVTSAKSLSSLPKMESSEEL